MDDSSFLQSGESQASQILANAIGGGADITWRSHSGEDHSFRAPESSGSRLSSESASSLLRAAAPRYHFHGLAATQTQSQYEEPPSHEGSQKENTPASGEVPPSPSFHNPPSTPSNKAVKAPQGDLSHPPSHPSIPSATLDVPALPSRAPQNPPKTPLRGKTTKAVSFVSPSGPQPNQNIPRTQTYPTHTPRSRRSPSPASQDSFAGPLPDPAKAFLATSRQFEVPLSELGRPGTTQDSSAEEATHLRDRREEGGHTSMFGYPSRRMVPSSPVIASSPSRGDVLVAATPSNSDSSQNQPSQPSQASGFGASQDPALFSHRQPTEEIILDEINRDLLLSDGSQVPFDDTQPSSDDYERVLNPGPEDIATQLEEYEATQPTSENEDLPHDDHEETVHPPPVIETPMTATTNPRGVLSMVPAWKRQKYMHHLGADAANFAPRTAQEPPVATPNVISETQPNTFPAPSFVPEPSDPRLNQPTPHGTAPPLTRGFPRNRRVEDPMEVVPDSEPPHTGRSPLSPSRTARMTSPPNQGDKGHAAALAGLAGDIDFVPDSLLGRDNHRDQDEADDEDDDDDDDVPLAVAVPLKDHHAKGKSRMAPEAEDETLRPRLSAVSKGKQKETEKPSSRRKSTPNPTRPPSVGVDRQQKRRASGNDGKSSSSADAEFAVPLPPDPEAKRRQGNNKTHPPTSRKSSRNRTASATPAPTEVTNQSETEGSGYEGPLLLSPSRKVKKVARKEEEEETEPADDDYMDVDDKPNSRRTVDPGPSRKRKRQPTTSTATRASSKAPATKLAKSLATPTTTRRPAKRLRSVTSSSRGLAADATRVFALWKNDSHYYSGVVHSLKSGSSTLYHVKFDDGTEGDVEIRQLRQAILVVGDEVILINGDLRGKVTEDKLESDGVVVVEVDDGDELDHLEVGLSEVRIAGRTLLKQWKDRLLHADSIITQVQPKPLKGTPSPSKMSMVSGTSATKTSKCRFFSKTGLVVTLSPGNRDWDQVKGDIEKSINSHGGTVIDDWSSVISIRGKHSQSNKRWVVEKDDVRWSGREGIERVFLLSDEANSKPKYLIALALGVPCLSTDWLRACLQEGEKDWQPYLLPAGFSEPLNARVSQMVDLDWGNSFEHVREIMANPVAAKLLSDLSVLCLSPDFVPLATTKTSKRGQSSSDADKAKEASRTIPLIVLAMGASRVEAVTEAKFASQDLSSYDYVVVKELGDINKIGNDGVTCVHLSWVKDCLMVGRLLPRPE